jgi:DNA-binding response OmpR family regulator
MSDKRRPAPPPSGTATLPTEAAKPSLTVEPRTRRRGAAAQTGPPGQSSDILVVVGDSRLAARLGTALREHGYSVVTADSGTAALRSIYEQRPGLALIEVELPGLDGLTVCQLVREIWDFPIVLITAGGSRARVRGIVLGADDVLSMPIDLEELLLRIEAVLRRTASNPYLERPVRFTDSHLHIDLASREVEVDGQAVSLTPTEFGLLRFMVQHPNQPIPSHELLSAVWGDVYADAEATLRVHVHHLRRKLEPVPDEPVYIRTERGVGYRFQTFR